jgi:prevent-host-death family protein
MKTISAAEANRRFYPLLREVTAGEVITILSRGKPVATIAPVQADKAKREVARLSLLERLRRQQPLGECDWTREELYEI